MRNVFLRIENWLLVTPAILLIIEWLFIGESVMDVHFHDTYLVMPGASSLILILILLLIPYMYHLLLRTKGKRSILFIHVISTVVSIVAFFICSKLIPTTPRRYYDFSNWESFHQFGMLNNLVAMIALALITIQLLFIVYAITWLFINKPTNKKESK